MNNVYIPEKIRAMIGSEPFIRDKVGQSSSEILLFMEKVLKIQRKSEETRNERDMCRWIGVQVGSGGASWGTAERVSAERGAMSDAGKEVGGAIHGNGHTCNQTCSLQQDSPVRVPEIFAYVEEGDMAYTLESRIRGKMLCDEEYRTNPQLAVRLAAEGLKALWSVDIASCPYTVSRIGERLKMARYNVEHGLVDVENTEPETFGAGRFHDPMELLLWLEANCPDEDLVLTHGDFCLPNIMVEGGRVSGFIDLGKAGPADRWTDIAICYRSLKHNFEGAYGGAVVCENFQLQSLLDELGVEPDEVKQRFYFLLDELF